MECTESYSPLILVASPEHIDKLILQAESSFGRHAKKAVIGAAAIAATTTVGSMVAGASLIGASAMAVKKYGFSKDAISGGVNDLKELTSNFLKSEDLTLIQIEDKLQRLSDLLELRTSIKYVPLKHVKKLNLSLGEIVTDGTFFIEHPFLHNAYIRPAEYDSVLAKEKSAAFKSLAGALGAKTIKLISFQSNEATGFFSSKVSPNVVAPEVGLNATFDDKGTITQSYFATFKEPLNPPRIPANLEKWVSFDPDLRCLAQDRLDNNLQNMTIALHFKKESHGASEIAACIINKGFNAGGKYKKVTESTWTFEVDFY